MSTREFKKLDRERVIEAVEDHYGIKLKQIGPTPKWSRDESGRNWWVLGGIGNWHGISIKMMDDEEQNPTNGMFVFARKESRGMAVDYRVFAGSVEQIVKAKDKLHLTKQYYFNCKIIGDYMKIKELDDFMLKECISFSCSCQNNHKETKTTEQSSEQSQLSKAREAVNALTAEEKNALMKELLGRIILTSLSEEECRKLLRKLLDEFL